MLRAEDPVGPTKPRPALGQRTTHPRGFLLSHCRLSCAQFEGAPEKLRPCQSTFGARKEGAS